MGIAQSRGWVEIAQPTAQPVEAARLRRVPSDAQIKSRGSCLIAAALPAA